MSNDNLTAMYDLADESASLLNNLSHILANAKRLGVPIADDADHLYMRLRVVLGAIGDLAFALDPHSQYDANADFVERSRLMLDDA